MNKIIVQKYGGSSVASIERIKRIAEKIVETAKDGDRVVVVVSAMGKTTDDLIKMAGQITSFPNERELDMLISTGEQVSIALLTMAIHALGWDAISFTGMQAGIVTNAVHTKAKVTAVNHKKIKSALEKGKIVIVAGFQGIDANGDITTLGRGLPLLPWQLSWRQKDVKSIPMSREFLLLTPELSAQPVEFR